MNSLSTSENPDSESNVFQLLLSKARDGDRDALAELLNEHRNYLLLIANQQIDNKIRGKVGSSDIVQETLITAHEKFDNFIGDDQQQLKAWLRQIVTNDVYEAGRRYKGTAKRQVDREQQIQYRSSIAHPLVDPNYTPKTNAIQDEESRRLSTAMSQLPEDYQQVIKLRSWEQLSFQQIGDELDRSEEAARKLWTRAIMKLQEFLPE